MINNLNLDMLDDGSLVMELTAGDQVLRASVKSIDEALASPLFTAFKQFGSGETVDTVMQNMSAEMTAVRTKDVV